MYLYFTGNNTIHCIIKLGLNKCISLSLSSMVHVALRRVTAIYQIKKVMKYIHIYLYILQLNKMV